MICFFLQHTFVFLINYISIILIKINKINKNFKKHGHKWGSGKFKQYCERDGCLAIKRLMENRFPKIGEAKYEWVIDEFDWESKVGKILLSTAD